MTAAMANGDPPPISDGTPVPRTYEDVETLVKRLYQPSTPSIISSVEKHLQWHQRSANGWDMAAALLRSNDVNVRFFGALTLTVKLNISGSDLDKDSAEDMFRKLSKWYNDGYRDAQMVAQKMASDLAILCLQPESTADGYIARVASSFVTNDDTRNGSSNTHYSLNETVPRLAPGQLLAVLKFASTLAEEGSKRLHEADKKLAATYQQHVETNIPDAVELFQHGLNFVGDGFEQIRTHALNGLVLWALFCLKSTSIDLERVNKLRVLILPALNWVAHAADYDAAGISSPIELLSDLLTHYPAFFRNNHLRDVSELLRSAVGQRYMAALKQGDPTAMPFARLLCAYADADLAHIAENPKDVAAQQILEMLHQLLCCEGYAAVEDDVIVEAQGLWNSLVEFVIDSHYDTSTQSAPTWHDFVKTHIVRMVEEFWAKIQYPPIDVYREWSEDEKKTFQQFRTDVRDLINTAHLALKTQLLEAFVKISLSSLNQRNWTQLEAALFCLYGVAESLDESDEEDDLTAEIMNSSLYPELTNTDPSIPLHVRRTAMRFIGSLGSYFERRPQSLPNALNYLFTSLEAASLADAASRSIYNLCTGSRQSLTAELGIFFQQYQHFLSSATATIFTKAKVIGAVAAIAQTLSTDLAKAEALTRLLDFIEGDVKTSLEHMAAGNYEQSVVNGTSAMACLTSVAKSFQETIEVVDLDSSPSNHSYWTSGDGAVVQERIIRLLSSIVEIIPNSIEILESVCDTLRAGFMETTPGPFVFLPSVVVSFLLRPQVDTNQLCRVLSTACGFIRAHTPASTPDIKEEAETLLAHVSSIIHSLHEPRNDPELAQSLVEVLTRYMPRYTEILINLKPASSLEECLNFTMACITAPEPLPKRAAATFWNTLLSLTAQPQPLQGLLDEVVTHCGSRLALAFVSEIGCNSMRSDIEVLADPIKRLYSRLPRSKSWFESAVEVPADIAAQEQNQGLQLVALAPREAKTKFLQSMRVAKDLMTVRKVIQEFGQACKMSGLRAANEWQGGMALA